jgi:hypothetical protein
VVAAGAAAVAARPGDAAAGARRDCNASIDILSRPPAPSPYWSRELAGRRYNVCADISGNAKLRVASMLTLIVSRGLFGAKGCGRC